MNKSSILIGSAVLAGCVLVGEMVYRHTKPAPQVAESRAEPEQAPPAETPVDAGPSPRAEASAIVPPPPSPIAATVPPPAARPRAATAPVAVRVRGVRPPDVIPDATPPVVPVELARTALAYVGADPEAEAVWATAINDPSLSAHARQDLIEDLNEDGFADPQNVTADELPLVVSRLALIEELAPDAMDQVNADAFDEAYKDLVNIYIRLTAE